jgi:hypothetical protein
MRRLERLKEEIIVVLCELKIYFPPSFFDVMVHILVHIVHEIKDLGPLFLLQMMPFKRMNGFIKKYVRNRAYLDGTYLTFNCVTEVPRIFCKEISGMNRKDLDLQCFCCTTLLDVMY